MARFFLSIVILPLTLFLPACGGRGGGSSDPIPRTVSGIVLTTTGLNRIAPAGGATVTAAIASPVQTKADGTFEIPDIPDGASVTLTVTKEGHTWSSKSLTIIGDTQVSVAIQKKSEVKSTVTLQGGTINTSGDPALLPAELVIPEGAVTQTVSDVTLTPYHAVQNLPASLPEGFVPVVGAELSVATETIFVPGKEADLFIKPPPGLRQGDLSLAELKLFEFTPEGWGERSGKGMLHTTGPHAGFVGPDPSSPARLVGFFPMIYAAKVSAKSGITGTVHDSTGAALPGAYVFGGGALAATNSEGVYHLDNVVALKEGSNLIPVTAAAPGFQAAIKFASLAKGASATLDLQLSTAQVAIIEGSVTDQGGGAIPGARVTVRRGPTVTSLEYNNAGTEDLTDDALLVNPPPGVVVTKYEWTLVTPAGQSFTSAQTGNSVVLEMLKKEAQAGGLVLDFGGYTVLAKVSLSDKVIEFQGAFLFEQAGSDGAITDIKLPAVLDTWAAIEDLTTFGTYKLLDVTTGESLIFRAEAKGFSPVEQMVAPLILGKTRKVDVTLVSSADTEAPSVPAGLTATAVSGSQIELRWSPVSDVVQYQIFRNGVKITTVKGTRLSDTGLLPETNYVYTVLACDATGNCSAQSSAESVKTPPVNPQDATPPSTPTGLAATPVSTSQIFVRWQPAGDNVAVTAYQLFRNGVKIATVTETGFIDSGLASGVSYAYTVAACDAAGNCSGQSVKVSAIPVPDTTAPTVISTTPAKNATGVLVTSTISATFSEAMDTNTINQTTFIVSTGGSLISGRVSYNVATDTATFAPAANLVSSGTYAVVIPTGVKDLAGNSLAATFSWQFTAADIIAPTLSGEIRCSDCSPGSPPGSPTSFSLKLTWPLASDSATPAGDITYEVCVRKQSCAAVFVTTATLKGSACGTTCLKEVGALESGTEYLFGVRAVDLGGNTSVTLTGGPAKTFPSASWACIAFAPPDVLISDTTENTAARRNQWERCRLDQEKTALTHSFSPAIAMVGDAPYATWISDVSGKNHLYVRHYDTSVASPTWRSDFGSTSTGLNDPNKSAQQPRLAALGTKIYLAYIEDGMIVVKQLDTFSKAGGAIVADWTTLPAVTSNAGLATEMVLAVAKDGGNDLPTVAWIESGLKIKQFNGSSWVDPPNTNFMVTGAPHSPALSANGTDIYFAWSDCPSALPCQILVKRLDESGGGTGIRIDGLTTNAQTFSGQISLTFVGSVPHIAWVQSLNTRTSDTSCSPTASCRIFVKKLVGGDWDLVGNLQVENGAAATGRTPSLAGSTSPYIAFQVGTVPSDKGRITVKHFNGSDWVTDRDENAFAAFGSLSTIDRESINFFPDDLLDIGDGAAATLSTSSAPHVIYLEGGWQTTCVPPSGAPDCNNRFNRPFVKRLK